MAQINQIFAGVAWMADPFRQLLAGKTYLPRNKLRLSLLRPGRGFMGHGAYREHFFGQMSLRDLLAYGLREKVRYSATYQAHLHRRRYRQRTTTPGTP